jgi:hypothetical protein
VNHPCFRVLCLCDLNVAIYLSVNTTPSPFKFLYLSLLTDTSMHTTHRQNRELQPFKTERQSCRSTNPNVLTSEPAKHCHSLYVPNFMLHANMSHIPKDGIRLRTEESSERQHCGVRNPITPCMSRKVVCVCARRTTPQHQPHGILHFSLHR